uniref:Ovule protein n=1 Tax=Ascaris lumbricoides TaxID=6252 RepID=A0A0M3IN34_ASCLU
MKYLLKFRLLPNVLIHFYNHPRSSIGWKLWIFSVLYDLFQTRQKRELQFLEHRLLLEPRGNDVV